MKKRFLLIPNLLVLSLLSGCSCSVISDKINGNSQPSIDPEFENYTLIDNVYYRVVEGNAEVVAFDDDNYREIEIKTEVEINGQTYRVLGISNNRYIEGRIGEYNSPRENLNSYSFSKLTIPEGIEYVNEYGLACLMHVKELVFPSTLKCLKQGSLFGSQMEKITISSFGSDYGFFNDLPDDYYYNDSVGIVREELINSWMSEHNGDYMSLTYAYTDANYSYAPEYSTSLYEAPLKTVVISGGTYLFPYSLYGFNLDKVYVPSSIKKVFGSPLGYNDRTILSFSSIEDYLSIRFDNYQSCFSYSYYTNARTIYIDDKPIKELVIPEGTKEIVDYAFYGCRELEKITIPSSLERVGMHAFYSFGSVKMNYSQNGFYLGNENNPYVLLAYTSDNIDAFTFHEDCKAFLDIAFDNSKDYLTSVTFNEGIKVIPNNAFAPREAREKDGTTTTYPTQLKEVHFSGDNNIEVIGEHAFYSSNLSSFSFSEKIHYIGKGAFYGGDYLATINWPYKVNELSIGDGAFLNDFKLSNYVYIPDGTVKVGRSAFSLNVDKASFITIPASLEDIVINEENFYYDNASPISVYHHYEETAVLPVIYFESSHSDYPNLLSELNEELEHADLNVSNITYIEGMAFSQAGYLYEKGETFNTFNGFIRENKYVSGTTIPDEICGLPVERVKLLKQDTALASVVALRLNNNCKELCLTEFTPKKVVGNLNLESIDNSLEITGWFTLFFAGDETEFKVTSVPSNVSVYYYSETKNADGHHWHYVSGTPTVWTN